MSLGGAAPQPGTTAQDTAAAQAAAEAKAKAEAEAKAAAEKAAWDQRLQGIYTGAIGDASKYFTDRGVDPTDYLDEITTAAGRAKGLVPYNAADPSAFFSTLGQDVMNTEQGNARSRYGRAFDQFAPTGFETGKIADTADDASINAIDSEAKYNAQQYVENLLKRGVINGSGYNAATKNVNDQGYKSRARLGELGQGLIAKGRTQIGNIANAGRSGAANYQLGNQFDPFGYSTQINDAVGSFFSGIGDNLRGLIPGDLYSTAGLPGVAGAAQGAQNLRFDPAALAGLTDDPNDPAKNTNTLSVF